MAAAHIRNLVREGWDRQRTLHKLRRWGADLEALQILQSVNMKLSLMVYALAWMASRHSEMLWFARQFCTGGLTE